MKLRITFLLLGLFVVLFIAQPVFGVQDAKPAETDQQTASEDKSQAAGLDKPAQLMKEADALFEKDTVPAHKRSLALYEAVIEMEPNNFEAIWKAARSCRYYAEESKKSGVSGWEDICREYGKKGMALAQKAIELEPDKPAGYYYYALCVGSYSDSVGIFTALREGLKDKTQDNLEKAYELNKYFDNGGPIIAIGRFWQVVPWPYHDEDKALEYYREFQNTKYFDEPEKVEAHIYLAEILMDQWGSGPKKEARQLLEEALNITDEAYWENRARELLNDL